jgi:hypothetical protein
VLSYLIVSRRDGAPLDELTTTYVGPPDLPELTFWPDEHISWFSDDRSVAFVGWQAATDIAGVGSHWTTTPDSLTAFSGFPLRRSRSWDRTTNWADQLRADLAGGTDPHDGYLGVFSIVHGDARDRLSVTTDPLGVARIYHGRNGTLHAVSNRADLVARALTRPTDRPRRSVLGAGWLLFFGYTMGSDTTYEDVHLVPPGAAVTIGTRGRLSIGEANDGLFVVADGTPHEHLLDAAEVDLVEHARRAGELPLHDRMLMLSGGKDSRLVLAALHRAGQTAQLRARTDGWDHSPDCLVAKSLAAALDVPIHQHTPSGTRLDAGAFRRTVREHAHLTSGALTTWTLRASARWSRRCVIGGLFGELLRTHYGREGIETPGDLRLWLDEEMAFDAAGLIGAEAAEHYWGWIRDWISGRLEAGVRPCDIPEVFYATQRMRHWVGAQMEIEGSPLINPLYTVSGLRAALRAGPEARGADSITFQLIERLSPGLLEIPLANDTWHPRNWQTARTRVAARPAPVTPTGPPAPPSWQTAMFATYRPVFEEAVAGADERLRTVLDVDRALEAIAGFGRLSAQAKVNTYSLAGVYTWLEQLEHPARFS